MKFRIPIGLSIQILIYLLVVLIFFLFNNDSVPLGLYNLWIVLSFVGVLFFFFLNKYTPVALTIPLFLYNTFFSLILFSYYTYINHPYGLSETDALGYFEFVNGSSSFSDVIYKVDSGFFSFSDWGFSFVRYIIKVIFPCQFYQDLVLIFINISLVILGSIFVRKLAANFFDTFFSKIIMILWGTNTYGIFVSASGLKENIFVFFVIVGMTYGIDYLRNKRLYSLIICCGAIFITAFFRVYITVFLVVSVFCYPIYTSTYLKGILPKLLFSLLLVGLFFNPILKSFSNIIPFLESVLAIQEHRSGGFIGLIVNFISSVFGPFPNYNNNVQEAQLLYSSFVFIKMIISYYFIIGLKVIFLKCYTLVLPLVIFCFLNMFLIIVSNTGLDIRFQYTMLPFFFIVSFFGLRKELENRSYKFFIFYSISFIFVTLFYNLR